MRPLLTDRVRALAALMSPIAAATIVLVVSQGPSRADEGGVSFWLPGQFGSLAAVPAQPGWAFADILYFTDVRAGRRGCGIARDHDPQVQSDRQRQPQCEPACARAFQFRQRELCVRDARAGRAACDGDDGSLRPSFGVARRYADHIDRRSDRDAHRHISDERFAWADLYPMASLRWNHGVHNFMIYGTGDIPVGTYDFSNLANLGIGHGAADGGVGYTYFNPATGHEFSAVTGVTYNLTNNQTGLPERHRLASGLGRLAVPLETGFCRSCRLFLSAAHAGQRSVSAARRIQIARDRRWPADRVPVSGRGHAGLSQPEGLRRIRGGKPARGMEHLGNARDLAGSEAGARPAGAAGRPQVTYRVRRAVEHWAACAQGITMNGTWARPRGPALQYHEH